MAYGQVAVEIMMFVKLHLMEVTHFDRDILKASTSDSCDLADQTRECVCMAPIP